MNHFRRGAAGEIKRPSWSDAVMASFDYGIKDFQQLRSVARSKETTSLLQVFSVLRVLIHHDQLALLYCPQ